VGDASGPSADVPARAANELTMTIWDPVSKQPLFKTAACRLVPLGPSDGETKRSDDGGA
jgi:hypothetical protein